MSTLPTKAKVVIIGGGIHGLSTAWKLSETYKNPGDIVILEKKDTAAGASGIACGVIRNNYFQPAMRELMAHSVSVWESDPKAWNYNAVGYLQISPEVMHEDVATIYEQQKAIGYESEFIEGEKACTKYMKGMFDDWQAQGITSVLHEKKGGYAFNKEKYLNFLTNLNTSVNIITDKTPGNFQNIGFIFSMFPDAKIIHLKRDPTATCWSIYKSNWSRNSYKFSYNIDDLVKFYALYYELMEFWHKRFPEKIYDICYEDLTTNQEQETKKLLKYCELDWDENCLNFHKNKRAVKTASLLQVREKMYQGSSEAWKKYEDQLKPLIDGLKPY